MSPQLIPQDGADNEAAPADQGDAESGAGEEMRPRLIPGSDETSGEQPASGQEQADLEQVVNKALKIIHGPQSRDQVLKQLHDPSRTIPQVVGSAAYHILSSVAQQYQATTKESLSESVLKEALGYVVPELVTVGCAAGIFPFDVPDGEDAGGGSDPFNKAVRMAALEATKLYGEEKLKGSNAKELSAEAQDEWAAGVAQEAQQGKLNPKFKQMAEKQAGPAATGAAPVGADDGA